MLLPQRKKQRPIRSCLSCRTRRIRCDQVHPICTNCSKVPRPCQYDYSWEDPNQANQASQDSNESTLPLPVSGGATVSGARQRMRDMGHLNRSAGSRTQYLGPAFWGINDVDGPEFPEFLQDRAGEGPDVSCLCSDCGGLQEWIPTGLSSLKLLRREVLNLDSLHSLGPIVERLPPRTTCDRLWATFMDTIYPLVPILHLPTFYRQYEEFWLSIQGFSRETSPTGFLAETPSFLALLLSTLFCGSLENYLTRSPNDTRLSGPTGPELRESRRLYRLTMQSLTMLGFPRDPTIYSLAAFFIWHIPLIREESERSTAFINIAFRTGQALGLHRDPRHFGIHGPEAEMRRRLWWHILHKDALSSAASGLPQMMWNQKQHDTEMICERKDAEWDNQQQYTTQAPGIVNNPPSQIHTPLGCVDFRSLEEADTDCRQVVSVGRFLITNTMREILGRQTDLEPWTIQDVRHFQNIIQRAAVQVKGRVDRLQAIDETESSDDFVLSSPETDEAMTLFRQASITSWTMATSPHNFQFLSWGRRLLILMLERLHCALYHPLQKYPDKALWHEFREIAMSHFHAYIEQYILMCTEPLYAPFYWIYPGNYQPIQAVAFLLADLIERPKSNEAPVSRHLIDRVFSVVGHQEGVVAERKGHHLQRRLSLSGKAAWAMLWRLRRRAWTAMGIDPSVMWTCARKHDHNHDSSESEELNVSDAEDTQAGVETGAASAGRFPATSDTFFESMEQFTSDLYFRDMHITDAVQEEGNAAEHTFEWQI